MEEKDKGLAACSLCENEKESIEHALLQCEWTFVVRHGLDIGYKVDK